MSTDDDSDDYPEVEVDSVYCTITSRASYVSDDSRADLNNIRSSHLAGGVIRFLYDGTPEEDKKNVSYYVNIPDDCPVDQVARYMCRAWKKKTPDIILSVLSSMKHYKRWKNLTQVEDFQAGLVQAINTTNMWILTNGLDGGITKIVGDAVRNERERRAILKAREMSSYLKLSKAEQSQSLTKVTLIGIAPKLHLKYGADLNGEHESAKSVTNKGTSVKGEVQELNGEHSHFIMVEDVKTLEDLEGFRLRMEERLLTPVGQPKRYRKITNFSNSNLNFGMSVPDDLNVITSTTTPMVGLLIQGGPMDIDHAVDLVKRKVPILVVKGTGLAADLISFVYQESLQQAEEQNELYIKTELIKRMMICFHKDFEDDELARNRCRDRILECVSCAFQGSQKYLTILDINTDPSALKNLDKYILLALFESQPAIRGHQFQEQFQSDLKLTLDWNRPDIAMSQIFNKYDWKKIKIAQELLDFALLKRDREKFVDIFLEKKTITLHKYLHHKKLLHLFNKIEQEEFFCKICLQGVLQKPPDTSYPVDKYFVVGKDCDLNALLYKLTRLKNLVPTHALSMNYSGKYVCEPALAERQALNALVLWAALTNKQKLTKVLWKKADQPMAMGLIVSMIWYNLAKTWCRDLDTKRSLKNAAVDFGKQAVNLLDLSYKDSCLQAIAVLDQKMPEFNNKTVIEIAHIARNKYFIAHKSCQKWLVQRWQGSLQLREVQYMTFTLPNWMKIYLSLLFIFPMFVWITYDKKHKEVQQNQAEMQSENSAMKLMMLYCLAEEGEEQEDDEANTQLIRNMSMSEEKWKRSRGANLKHRVKRMLSYSAQNLKVPVYLQFYYLWSAPITKFYISQLFYIMYLVLFSLAVAVPSCKERVVDMVLFFWTIMIWVELVRKTVIKKKTYREMSIKWSVVEIVLIGVYLIIIGALRVIPHSIPYFTGNHSINHFFQLGSYTNSKTLMSFSLLYFYYRTLNVFLPASPILGPMLINIRRMIRNDFVTWFRMFLIVMVSGGITIQAVLYPSYPFSLKALVRALSRAFFAMFLTKIDDLEGTEDCQDFYDTKTRDICFDSEESFARKNLTRQIYNYKVRNCPYSSWGGYVILIQYLLITKLILLTLLYALFSATNSQVQKQSYEIWKYQKYSLIVDFETCLRLPAPLNIISYFIMLIELLYENIRWLCKKIGLISNCCTNRDTKDSESRRSVVKRRHGDDHTYWRSCMKRLTKDQELEEIQAARVKTQTEKLELILTQLGLQKHFNEKMTQQMTGLERHLLTCTLALEQVQHKLDNLNPKAGPALLTTRDLHIASRQSPYPGTVIQRFPVFDKYVSWEEPFPSYDPIIYTKPVEEFREEIRNLVDPDLIEIYQKMEQKSLTHEDEESLLSMQPAHNPLWNVSATYSTDGNRIEVNRVSWITNDGIPCQYSLDSTFIPINPIGRTGVRGRGELWRWGPNHCIMLMVSRWKRYMSTTKNEQNILTIDGKKVLEVIVCRRKDTGEFTLPNGKDYGDMSLYSEVCHKFMDKVFEEKDIEMNEKMTEHDMVEFFKQFVKPKLGPVTGFTASTIYKGYMDDPGNTDNAWREAEVWNIHFHEEDNIDSRIPHKEEKWKEVSSYIHLYGNQNLIVQEAAHRHDAYF